MAKWTFPRLSPAMPSFFGLHTPLQTNSAGLRGGHEFQFGTGTPESSGQESGGFKIFQKSVKRPRKTDLTGSFQNRSESPGRPPVADIGIGGENALRIGLQPLDLHTQPRLAHVGHTRHFERGVELRPSGTGTVNLSAKRGDGPLHNGALHAERKPY